MFIIISHLLRNICKNKNISSFRGENSNESLKKQLKLWRALIRSANIWKRKRDVTSSEKWQEIETTEAKCVFTKKIETMEEEVTEEKRLKRQAVNQYR